MTREQIVRYQAESVKRASMPPVAKHSQGKTNQRDVSVGLKMRGELMKKQRLNISYLNECFTYSPETGVLTWKARPLDHFYDEATCAAWNKKYAFKQAGYEHRGYLSLSLNGRNMFLHRIVMALIKGQWPVAMVDHINGNKSDNRESNLRIVDNAENGKNKSLLLTNKSGYHGVRLCKNSLRWHAYIYVKRKQIFLGSFKYKDEAVVARKQAEKELGFHSNHGRANIYGGAA